MNKMMPEGVRIPESACSQAAEGLSVRGHLQGRKRGRVREGEDRYCLRVRPPTILGSFSRKIVI